MFCLLPFIGALLAAIFYMVLRGGLLTLQTPTSNLNVYGFACAIQQPAPRPSPSASGRSRRRPIGPAGLAVLLTPAIAGRSCEGTIIGEGPAVQNARWQQVPLTKTRTTAWFPLRQSLIIAGP